MGEDLRRVLERRVLLLARVRADALGLRVRRAGDRGEHPCSFRCCNRSCRCRALTLAGGGGVAEWAFCEQAMTIRVRQEAKTTHSSFNFTHTLELFQTINLSRQILS